MSANPEEKEDLSLSKAAEMLLDECRMVLPGIQALFGFQLIAVFNEGFSDKLTQGQQELHALSIGFVLIAIMLIMSPAAYHRLQGATQVTRTFITSSTVLLLFSMFPLAVAICIDFYLVLSILFDGVIPLAIAGALFLGFMLLWFILPRSTLYRVWQQGKA
jgi:hypothetical protein